MCALGNLRRALRARGVQGVSLFLIVFAQSLIRDTYMYLRCASEVKKIFEIIQNVRYVVYYRGAICDVFRVFSLKSCCSASLPFPKGECA